MTLQSIMLLLTGLCLGGVIGWLLKSVRGTGQLHQLTGEQARNEELRRENEQLNSRLQKQEQEARESGAEMARLQTRLREREVTQQEMEKREEEQRQKLQNIFENTANKIFEDKSDRFKKQSREEISQTLQPLREGLTSFQKKMEESFGQQAKESFSLKEEIGRLVQANQTITTEARSLSDALRHDSKAQGQWGEITLEKILEAAGLRQGEEYTTQGAGMKLQDDLTGARQKPDVIINLPDDKHIIIDAKVSLKSYVEHCESEDEEKQKILKKFESSVKAHVDGLSERGYATTDKINSPDFVLMFMPIEGALVLLASECPDMHSYAWRKKIIIVGPTTLLMSLRTVHTLWRLQKQNKNAEKIATLGGRLYDKVVTFVETMSDVGKQLTRAHQAHDKAMSQLHSGHGNILGRAERMRQLGATTKKQLPEELLDDDIHDDEADTADKAVRSATIRNPPSTSPRSPRVTANDFPCIICLFSCYSGIFLETIRNSHDTY